MDVFAYVIATTDSRLALAARRQAQTRREAGARVFLEFGPRSTLDQICGAVKNSIVVGTGNRLHTLHICAHGNSGLGFVDIGTGLRAAQTRAFRAIRRCWINTRQIAIGASIEMNVCSAAGYGMTPIMMGVAADAGMPVRACPVPIPMDTLFAPPQGFRTFNPGPGAVITEADHVDVEVALSR